ncbi:MAG: hypothetical protein PF689_00705 [Deltaproteobacteria bacterium]|jgi:hypothetical protein|nr:hypothetical protein [Deltaproteobacteria bacterium]
MKCTLIEQIPHLFKIYELKTFRKTPGVIFDQFPMACIQQVNAIDRVLHQKGAISPGPVGETEKPWYMHPHQADNLIVLKGIRYVDLYTQDHGKVEHFTVEPNKIARNGKVIINKGAILVWPQHVFHRITSGPEGSASINIAQHFQGFDINTNFNIYSLNTDTGKFKVIRRGHEDQF